MKKAKLAASLIAVSMAATTLLTGCNNNPGTSDNTSSGGSSSAGGNSSVPGSSGDNNSSDPTSTPVVNPTLAENLPFTLTYPDNTEIRIAAGYNGEKTAITFDAKTAGEGVKLSDGNTYTSGSLKPTWVELSKVLKVTFNNKYKNNTSASLEFDAWKNELNAIDILCGTAAKINEIGTQGNIVDLSKYLDQMPNFKKYLDDNPIVRMSITTYKSQADGGDFGAIFFAPYFDGVNDIERMPLMRTDWVEKLLNGSGEFKADNSKNVTVGKYTPYMPTSGTVEVDVVKKDGSNKETIKKDYSKGGNIIEKMNAAGSMTGVEAVNMLRKYIDETYDGYYGNDRADLFIGQNAAWDADEMVALLRCVVANPQTLNGTNEVQGLFSRNDDANNRKVDTYKLAGILFGARGLESRQDFLYVGNDKKLHDARQEEATYLALEKMNQMAQEGLISESYLQNQKVSSDNMVQDDLGFMSYDYNQTQTIFNEKTADGKKVMDEGEKYRAVMVPVAKWDDGDDTTPEYMRFTESWRSVKDSGWCIPKATESNTDVLNACLHLFDYAFSLDGQILLSYGPDSFIDVKDPNGKTIEEKYNTFDFNGIQMPKISEGCRTDLWDKASGNYTNFARQYLGSTLHFVKSQAFEMQCTTAVGQEGAAIISNAIKFGTIKHPELTTSGANPWYYSVPTTLPLTAEDVNTINSLSELSDAFATGSKDNSMLVDMIINGYDANKSPAKNAKDVAEAVKTTWKGSTYIEIKNNGWDDLFA